MSKVSASAFRAGGHSGINGMGSGIKISIMYQYYTFNTINIIRSIINYIVWLSTCRVCNEGGG